MWSHFYRNGGGVMIPTTIFGFFLVASGVLLLLRQERRYLSVVASFGVLTLSSGALGCAMGLIKTFRFVEQIAPAEQVKVEAAGCAESLNNVVLALLFVVVASLLAAGAAIRVAREPGAAG